VPINVEDFIAHYASATYDPAAAHEYYLKNRELQGRKSTKGMSETQKEAAAYSKHQIGIAKKDELTKAQEAQKAQLEGIRQRTQESRERIRKKLEDLITKLKADAIVPVEKVNLNKIPPNASPRVKAYLQQQNAKMLDTANRKAAKATAAAQEVAGKNIDAARKEASDSIVQLGTDMKAAVTSARASYVESRKQLIAKYEAAEATELENIRTKLPGLPPKAPKVPKEPKARKPRVKKSETESTTEKEGEPSKW
jgi:hypothetical protein